MQSVVNLVRQLQRDEDGASLIEYTVLLAIILIATIGLIAAVGSWVSGKWHTLNAALS